MAAVVVIAGIAVVGVVCPRAVTPQMADEAKNWR